MGTKTEISWTDKTWKCLRGCSMAKGSELGGCLNCYAARLNARNLPELRSPTTDEPFARILDSGPRWTGKVELIEHMLELPLRWCKPSRIFVNSMSDVFHESITDETIDRIFAVMALAPQHTFQILTKRPERMLQWFDPPYDNCEHEVCGQMARLRPNECALIPDWPLPNVWLGVSIENQATADARIPLLIDTPAAIHFVSYEPALAPVNLNLSIGGTRWMGGQRGCGGVHRGIGTPDCPSFPHHHHDDRCKQGIDWVIVGGESGPGARPFDLNWARRVVADCRAAGVACFVKQLGAVPMLPTKEWSALSSTPILKAADENKVPAAFVPLFFADKKAGDWDEWPLDLRVREFPLGSAGLRAA